jgi:hypothetical protein
MEAQLAVQGRVVSEASPDALEALWSQAKRNVG